MLNENLTKARRNKDLTQDDVAAYLNIKRQTYSAYERGVSTPDALILQKIAEFFGVSADYLLGNSDNKKSPDNESELNINTLEYALYGEARELDEDEKKQLLELAKFMRKKRQEQDENK